MSWSQCAVFWLAALSVVDHTTGKAISKLFYRITISVKSLFNLVKLF